MSNNIDSKTLAILMDGSSNDEKMKVTDSTNLSHHNVEFCITCTDDNDVAHHVENESTMSATTSSSSSSSEPMITSSKRSRESNDSDLDDDVNLDENDNNKKKQNTMIKSSNSNDRIVKLSHDDKVKRMSEACKTILECIGEDPMREGLLKTPDRWAKSLLFLNSGYDMTPMDVTNSAVFTENHHEMVVVRNIDIHSLCEHHMLPFTGQVHIGYIPNGKIIGLSKLARIAELYARRLQVQERLTSQIADAIVETLQPLGVAVVMECSHYCMIMRGVQKTGTTTTTSSVRGCFEANSKTRAEFFSIIQR